MSGMGNEGVDVRFLHDNGPHLQAHVGAARMAAMDIVHMDE